MRRYTYTCCCIVLIFVLCFCKPSSIPVELPSILGLDKVIHLLMYLGTCGVMWTEYLLSHRSINFRRTALLAVVAPILMSIAIEVMQGTLTDFRGCDVGDVYANAVGVVLALLIPYGWWLSNHTKSAPADNSSSQ